jgi:hypothetical protein
MLPLIAGTVSCLHMRLLVELHGQSAWVAAISPLPVDRMIVAAAAIVTESAATSRPADHALTPAQGGGEVWLDARR